MKPAGSLIAFLAGAAMLSSCATLVNGTTQNVRIESEPPGAQVKIDNVPIGTTPTSIDLKRGDVHQVTIEKEGFIAHNETISQSTSGWFAGDILAGGLIGMFIDWSTGGMYNLTPQDISPGLVKAAETSPSTAVFVQPDSTKSQAAPASTSETGATASASHL